MTSADAPPVAPRSVDLPPLDAGALEGAAQVEPPRRDPAAAAWIERLRLDPGAVIPLLPAGALPPEAAVGGDIPDDATTQGGAPPKSGILCIDKPAGRTSHDVVAAVRRASGERRVGHAGTLDPMATGVLVVCLGSATRVIDEIQAMRKTYRARVRLGARTSTGDAEGTVVETRDPAGVTRAAVEAALDTFRGEILQIPPMVSALRHEGKRLYDLARQGIEVERAARPVTVYALELSDWEPPELAVRLEVSKGTYVRAIADDLGQALGVGAHLVALERLAVGRFTLESAERLGRVVEAFVEGWWPALLHPLDSALLDYAALVVDPAREAGLRYGQQIAGPAPEPGATVLVRAYNEDGRFIGLIAWDEVTGQWQPTRIFPKAR